MTLRRALRGDAEAYGLVVRAHEASARRVATVVLGSVESVDDVMQEAAIRAWNGLDTFRQGAAFGPWFLKIVANTARNHQRSTGRRAAMQLRATGQRQLAGRDPADEIVLAEEHEQVITALNQLSEPDRLVLALRHFEGLSESAMAEVLECAPGTVKSRLSRATSRLRDHLATGQAAERTERLDGS